jgi:hypothetical protein
MTVNEEILAELKKNRELLQTVVANQAVSTEQHKQIKESITRLEAADEELDKALKITNAEVGTLKEAYAKGQGAQAAFSLVVGAMSGLPPLILFLAYFLVGKTPPPEVIKAVTESVVTGAPQ